MWVTRAMERAQPLQINLDKLLASYDLVCGALGMTGFGSKTKSCPTLSHGLRFEPARAYHLFK
jgi:hypothetical protein